MSDFSHMFKPWESFTKGLYLAGAECRDDVEAPNGWTKWVVPGYEYIYIECEEDDIFPRVIKYLEDNSIPLVGPVHDFTCPQTGKNYMFFTNDSAVVGGIRAYGPRKRTCPALPEKESGMTRDFALQFHRANAPPRACFAKPSGFLFLPL